MATIAAALSSAHSSQKTQPSSNWTTGSRKDRSAAAKKDYYELDERSLIGRGTDPGEATTDAVIHADAGRA